MDTNLYVRAFRSRQDAADLESFYFSFAPSCFLSSIVFHELLAGANTKGKARRIHEDIARPFARTARVVTPLHAAWESSAEGLARMAREDGLELRRIPKSLVHDFLLAASCREAEAILITDNSRDFDRIQRLIPFEFLAPWPIRVG
ncbi:MAG TPA: PIN domain-containing protein [Gemmatimonadota bacterium]|nr:PIN domain-containing protein [Gemmatimonadota bacterium]